MLANKEKKKGLDFYQRILDLISAGQLIELVEQVCCAFIKEIPELNSAIAKRICQKIARNEECDVDIFEFIKEKYPTLPNSSLGVKKIIAKDLKDHFFRSIIFFCEGLIEEYKLTTSEKNKGWVEERICQFVALSVFLNKQQTEVGRQNLYQQANLEISRNREVLNAVDLIAQMPVKAEEFHMIVSMLWKMITSNLVITSQDLNFRTVLNSQKGVSHSLFIPYLKELDWYSNPLTGEYVPFVEATASSQIDIGKNPGQLSSTFGFLHLLALDEKGIAHVQEYPHIMFGRASQNLPEKTQAEMAEFEKKFRRNHDLFHHLIQVYAKHFAVHHLYAPITLKGYLPAYLEFAEGMRQEKEGYELLISNLHAEVFNQMPKNETAADFQILEKTLNVLKKMKDENKEANIQDFADYHAVLFTTRALNVFPSSDERYQKIREIIEKMSLKKIKVTKKMVLELLQTQGIIIKNQADEEQVSQLKLSSWPKKQIGVESLLESLEEIGLIPLKDEVELSDFNICKWAVIMMPQKPEQKGFAIKALGTKKYPHNGREIDSKTHLIKQVETIMEDVDEYQKRVLFIEALEKILFQLFKVISSVDKLNENQIADEKAKCLDELFCNLYALNFDQAKINLEKIELKESEINNLLVLIKNFLRIPYVANGNFAAEIQKIKNQHMKLG